MVDPQKLLDDVCTERKIPGAVLGIVQGDDVTVVTHGIANLNTSLPVVPATLFQAGSIGKSYTATAIMQLVDDGTLDLDAPLRTYVTDLEFEDAEVSKTLTARQVLTHTAGIDGDRIEDDGSWGRGDDCLARYVAGLGDLPLITSPGGLWSYCNSGYIVLGRLLEVLTGMTYEAAMTQRFLQPAGLTDTLFFPEEMVTHSLAVAHVRQGTADPVVSPVWAMSRAAGPAGATINTTIDDLLGFARIHLSGGVAPNGTRVLTEESVRAMQEPLAACPEPELLGDHWGLGWFLRTLEGPTVFGHDGNTVGLTASLRIIPERNAAWGLLMNLAGQNWAAAEVAWRGLDERLGTITPRKPEPSGATITDGSRFEGSYKSVASTLTVTAGDAGLRMAVHASRGEQEQRMEGELVLVDDDRFLVRIPELSDDLPLTFMERDGHQYGYIHMGARLYRRVA